MILDIERMKTKEEIDIENRVDAYYLGWNEAIEKVIDELDKIGHCTEKDIARIRKLKK